MEKIGYRPEVKQYLKDLAYILFKREYFGYLQTSIEYVERLTTDIEKYIDIKQHKLTPRALLKYGKYYASFSVNRRTTWYVIFSKSKGNYIIRYITNNHMPEAAILTRA